MDIEQTTETTTQTEPTADQASRDELIAAVREAGGTGSVDVGAEEEAAKAPATTPAATETAAAPAEDDKIAAILKAREERHKKRLDAESYADEVIRKADAEKQRIIDEARAEAKRVADQELAELRAKFSGSPTATLRALGTADEITDAVMREGSPEAKALRAAQEDTRKALEAAQEGKTAREELTRFKEDLAKKEAAAQYASVRDQFLTTHAAREHAPALHAQFRNPDAVFRALDAQCREWQADGLQRGVDFDDATLVKYVETQSRKWLQEMGFTLAPSSAQQASADGPAKGPGPAPKALANGSRTLSAAAGSERRTSPRPITEMKPDEARAALIEEVAAARRANPDATS